MTSPNQPSGADAAGARNREAVDDLTGQASRTVGAAINAMLAEVLAELAATPADAILSVDSLTARAREAWTAAVGRVLAWVRRTFTRLVTRDLDNLPDDVAPELDQLSIEQRVQQLTTQVADALRDVPDVLASRTTTALRDGYDQGESPAELRQRVADVLSKDEWAPEVERIARTTTTTVYNAAHTAAADQLEQDLGEPLRRMWIATHDQRTRPTHREAHGQVIDSGERFRVGDALLRFPGDPLAPPGETVNCRCVTVPVVNDVVIDLARRVTGRGAAVLTEAENDQMTAQGWKAWPAWQVIAAAALTAVTRIPPALRTYWTRGKGAAKIRWGTPGDFNRCRRALRKYVSPAQLDGLCANLHHAAIGVWPGQERASATAAIEEEGDMPCPCESMTDDEIKAAVAQLDKPVVATVTGDPDLPLAGRDVAWDGSAAEQAVAQWARTDDGVDPDRYSRAFFYRDPDADATTQAAYKLGFATVVDGELRAVPKGLFAVAAVLQGGRGGVDIPQEEQDRIKSRVAAYYRRMADEFDDDSIVAPWDTDSGSTAAVTAAALDEAANGGMVALLPSMADQERLAVTGDGAISAADLHVTLLFLGDDGAQWQGTPEGDALLAVAERVAADIGPITGTLWQTGATGGDAATGATAMYLVGDDTGRLAELQAGLVMAGDDTIPDQRSPFVAHISTRYGNGSTDGMGAVGSEVTFDRIRVSYGDQDTDFELTGDDELDLDEDLDLPDAEPVDEETPAAMPAGVTADVPQVVLSTVVADANIVAQAVQNAPVKPPAEWLRPVQISEPTPMTITAEGRVWGLLGQRLNQDGTIRCHRGIRDECVPLPPTRTNYGAFHTGEIETETGDMVAVGYLYTGCDHSSTASGATMDDAREHLESACVPTAVGRAYETEWGPMFVGSIVPGVSRRNVDELAKMSGEWFTAPLELHAAVGVTDAGFPVDGAGDTIRTADQAPPLAASADTGLAGLRSLIADYRQSRARRAVAAAASKRAARAVAAYQRRT